MGSCEGRRPGTVVIGSDHVETGCARRGHCRASTSLCQASNVAAGSVFRSGSTTSALLRSSTELADVGRSIAEQALGNPASVQKFARRGILACIGRIGQRPIWLQACHGSHTRRLDAVRGKDVKDVLLSREQIVRNDAPVASPPHRFRAHDGAAPRVSCLAQLSQAGSEGTCRRVIRIVVKALVFPERIHRRRHVACFASPTPQRGYVCVTDLIYGQSPRDCLLIVMRIRSRSRHASHIDNEVNVCLPQQVNELVHWPCRMSDREEWFRHSWISRRRDLPA